MEVREDDQGNRYIEVDRPPGAKIVLTYIPDRNWAQQDVVSMRLREDGGALRFGPEVPIDQLGDFISGIIHLLNDRARTRE